MSGPRTPIQTFYKDKVIFITGASGFMGKVLLEKLLYSCSDLDKIYILIRAKKERSIELRMDDMFKLPMFCRIREKKSHILKKVKPLKGDISLHNLGLTDDQRETLMKEVHLVFHFAAILQMNAKLKDAVELNMIGTKRVLDLARQMKHLQVFLHLGTVFCHVDQKVIGEKVYDAPNDPNDIMRLVQWMDEKSIDLITPQLLGSQPNTYTYTKHLAETQVAREYSNLLCVIVRPPIVTAAFKEPVSGWVDNLNNFTGILIAWGKGVFKTMLCKTDARAEIFPVDFAINSIIGISHKVATQKKPKSIPVYNITQNGILSITWGELLKIAATIIYRYPFEGQLWYPSGKPSTNKIEHLLLAFFYHTIPAYLIDFLMLISGRERFMIKLQKQMSNGVKALQYFPTRDWTFDNTKLLIMRDEMSSEDQKMFQIDLKPLDIHEYIKTLVLGTRQYYMKENLSSLPKARRRQAVMYSIHLFTKFLFCFGMLYFTYNNMKIRSCLNFVAQYMQLL